MLKHSQAITIKRYLPIQGHTCCQGSCRTRCPTASPWPPGWCLGLGRLERAKGRPWRTHLTWHCGPTSQACPAWGWVWVPPDASSWWGSQTTPGFWGDLGRSQSDKLNHMHCTCVSVHSSYKSCALQSRLVHLWVYTFLFFWSQSFYFWQHIVYWHSQASVS